MVDCFDKDTRSRIMAGIRPRGTNPEMILKKALRGYGFVYQPKMACNPDFVHKKHRVAVYVHGCFWHGCPKHYKKPKSNKNYWIPKIERNVRRDMRNIRILRKLGYSVLVFWEHDILKNMERCLSRIHSRTQV